MERVLNIEERIKRAEEIWERRNNSYKTNVATVNVNEKRKISVYKKMIVQVLICFSIYLVLWIIQDRQYIFSEIILNKANEVLLYDINIQALYNNAKEKVKGILVFEEDKKNENQEIDNAIIENNIIEKKEENNVVENNVIKDKETVENLENISKQLTQMEIDVNEIKAKYEMKKPVDGIITSWFGEREVTSPLMSQNHKGIDIGADEGTKIKAVIGGNVLFASYDSELGNYITIQTEDIVTIYAHCKKLYVKQGQSVSSGEEIAEVGSTRSFNRSTFAF